MRKVLIGSALALMLVVGGAFATSPSHAQRSACTPRSQCCKVCVKGKACGNSCINRNYTCRKGRGCACNGYEVCGG